MSQLNLANVERLRVAIHETPDRLFNYRYYRGESCGCVMSVSKRTFDDDLPMYPLGLTDAEQSLLLGGADEGCKAKLFCAMTAEEAAGANGKREALRRLSVILQRRYGSWRVPA